MAKSTSRQLRRAQESQRPGSNARAALALANLAPLVLRLGWSESVFDPDLLLTVQMLALGVYGLVLVLGWRSISGQAGRQEFARAIRPEAALVIIGLGLGWWGWPVMALASGGLALAHLLRIYLKVVQSGAVPPGLVFVGSFLILIVLGVGAIKLPSATPEDHPIGWIDATFTITSAISQTGLVVRPTGEEFTRFGQIIIMIWIQVGALGVIVFGALLATVLGSGFGLKATQTIADGTEQGWAGQLSLQKLVAFIIVFTHAAELAGALILYFGWPETWDGAPEMAKAGDRFFHCLFFSVSAFCNAGFVTTSNSLEGLRSTWTSHIVIVPLIVLGSIGFPVLDNLRRTLWARVRGVRVIDGQLIRLTLNTKIILTTAVVLYVVGFGLIFLGEVTQATHRAVPSVQIAALDAHFMNMNRTSGFDTIDVPDMGLLSQLTMIAMMFIGGSPGSVAGGIKLMALAVLTLTAWATITGRSETTAFGRTLPEALVRKSAVIVMLFLATVMGVGGVLTWVEAGRPDGRVDILIFETMSAVGTCGWSMGATPDLSPTGRVAISVGMFIGRVGPLAVTAALVVPARRKRARYSYPEESVVVY